MNWQHLTYFKQIAESGQLTKAAEELHISPSALSHSITALESEIGVTLFDKQGRTLSPNRFGRVFYNYVKNANNEITSGINTIQAMSNIASGCVRVSSIFSVGTTFIPDLLSSFYSQSNNKDIRIELSQRTTSQILTDIVNGNLDIAFCGEFDRKNQFPNINREPLYNEEMMLIVPESHRLAAKDSVTFDDIQDEVFIGYNNSCGIVNTIYDAIAQKGYPDFRFKTILESNEDNNVTNLVRKGLGIAFVVNNPSLYSGGIKQLQISDLYFFRTIYMVWKQDTYLSPAVNKFRDYVTIYKALKDKNLQF